MRSRCLPRAFFAPMAILRLARFLRREVPGAAAAVFSAGIVRIAGFLASAARPRFGGGPGVRGAIFFLSATAPAPLSFLAAHAPAP